MNKYSCFILGCGILLSISCKKQSFLDPVAITDLNEKTVFADSARTMDFLANIYTGIDFSFDTRRFNDGAGGTGLSAACDEAEGPVNIPDNTYLQFATGSVNPNTVKDDVWSKPYSYIRAINQLLKNLPGAKFSNTQKTRVKGEALFLRAWYYSIMLKHYGGVPIVGDTIYNSTDVISSKRNTYEECVNYIVTQCDAAKQLLSRQYNQLDYGRITTGACQALKARVLLYAASPLFNGGNIDPGNRVTGYIDFSAERWKKAADAADSVGKMGYVLNTATYLLNPPSNNTGLGFYNVFIHKVNNELIFFRANPGINLEENLGPPSRRGLTNLQGTYPYQELVDAFDMINGKPITDPNSGYDPKHPYDNRDPRFDHTICHNLSLKIDYTGTVSNHFKPILIYANNTDPISGVDAVGKGTATGYYVNKMLRDSTDARNFYTGADRAYPLIRYAEVLLNFAEATNEYSGPTQEVYDALKLIRNRAGIDVGADKNYGLNPSMNKEQMRAAIQHERRIELAFEEHRFWDVRRWKIADATDNQLMTGMQIVLQKDGSYTYQKFTVRQHTFKPKNYLWPFPQREVSKPGGLVQNPGY